MDGPRELCASVAVVVPPTIADMVQVPGGMAA